MSLVVLVLSPSVHILVVYSLSWQRSSAQVWMLAAEHYCHLGSPVSSHRWRGPTAGWCNGLLNVGGTIAITRWWCHQVMDVSVMKPCLWVWLGSMWKFSSLPDDWRFVHSIHSLHGKATDFCCIICSKHMGLHTLEDSKQYDDDEYIKRKVQKVLKSSLCDQMFS